MNLIGLYADWRVEHVDSDKEQRIAASLGSAHGKPASTWKAGRFLCAETGHRRGWMPARTSRGEVVLFCGHLDNQDEIEGQLGQAFQRLDDLYAAAFARWGDAADLKLLGQFCTVLFHPDEGWIRLSRSPILAPPLHIWHDKDRVIVASIPAPLFATGEVRRELDEQKIADTLFLNYAEVERSYFAGVRRIAPGSTARLTSAGFRVEKFHDLLSRDPIRLPRDEDYVEAADELFSRASAAACRGFSNVAVSLSGGLDSPAVATYAMDTGQKVVGLTGVPEADWDGHSRPGSFGDERGHVAALAAMYPDLQVECVDAAGLSFGHRLQGMTALMGGPPRNAMNLHWIHAIRDRAKSLGRDVVFDGSLGNIGFSFGGEGALASWFLKGNWRTLCRELSAGKGDVSSLRFFGGQVVAPLMPASLWHLACRALGRAPISPLASWCPLNPEWARQMKVEERAGDMAIDAYYRASRSTRQWRSDVLTEIMNEGGEFQMAMETIHGVPARDPTAYRPFLEFCVSIPDDQYIRNGSKRWLARRLLQNRLPDMVLSERRRGRQAADWHLRIGRERAELIAEIDRLAEDPAMQERLNLAALRSALEDWEPTTPQDTGRSHRLELALSRGLATARFIRSVEGRN